MSRPHPVRRAAASLHDERGILLGALAKLVVFLVLLGLVLFESGAVIWSRLSAQDTADAAATSAVTTYRDTRDAREAEGAALALVEEKDPDAKLIRFQVHQDGSVTTTVRKRADTLLIQHIDFLRGFRVARGTSTIEAPSF